MSAVATAFTYLQKHPKGARVKQSHIDRPAIAINTASKAADSSVSTLKRTARKRSIQERRFDLSLARALLGGMSTPHHLFSEPPIRHQAQSFVPKWSLARFKLARFSIFTSKKQLVVM